MVAKVLQVGKVLRAEGEYALVHVEKKSGCGGERCPLSSSLIDDSRSDFYTVSARNDIGASVGDLVLVKAKDTVLLGIAFFLYLFPILLALGVYALFRALFPQESLAILGLFGSLGVSFLFLRRLNTRLTIEYRIVDFASTKECTECPLFTGSKR